MSPNCFALGDACCSPKAGPSQLVSVSRITDKLFSNPVDQHMKNANRRGAKDRTMTNVTNLQGKQKREILDFDLPSIEDEYDLDRHVDHTLGFGTGLRKYIHKKTRMPRAVLSIRKEQIPAELSVAEVRKQLELLCKIDHPNIVSFRECFEDHGHLKLAYDWCEGGPFMLQLWRFQGMLTEEVVAQVFHELLAALGAAHAFGVHHLDLSLLSLFLPFSDKLSPVKVFGFGLAGFLIPLVTARKKSTSNKHFYASPELYQNTRVLKISPSTRHASDMWSVGTMLYTLCCGRPPFGLGSFRAVATRVQQAAWSFSPEFSAYSTALKDFVELLLRTPWQKRATAGQALKHPWVESTQPLLGKDEGVGQEAFSQLNSFVSQDHVKQTMARLLIDIGVTSECHRELQDKFRCLDLNGDGTLELSELMEVARMNPGISAKSVDNIVKRLDRNGNCNIDINEFIGALIMEQSEADEQLIQKAFNKMDNNGDARVTKRELFGVLRQYSGSIDTNEVSKFVGSTDTDGDQKMDYREFMNLFPGVRDKYAEQKLRMQNAKSSIECGLKCLHDFQEALKSWIAKLLQKRDAIEIACGVREAPAGTQGHGWNYKDHHITEFDVQMMIDDVIETLQQVPGRPTKRQKQSKREQKIEKNAQQNTNVTGDVTKPQMMGISTLVTKEDPDAISPTASRSSTAPDSGTDSSGLHAHRLPDSDPRLATKHWINNLAVDRQKRMQESDCTNETHIYECLFWLVQVKSEFKWQIPLKQCIEVLRDACVQTMHEVFFDKKPDAMRMQSALTDSYQLREDIEFGDDKTTIYELKKGARLLPMGSMRHCDLKSKVHLEKMHDLQLPAHLVFGLAKAEVTHQRVEHMHHTYLEQMEWVGSFVTQIVESIEHMFQEVQEDLQMSSTMESLMPSPPPVSHRYLKHCLGREIQEDAATPRSSSQISDEEDEDQEISQKTKNSSSPSKIERNHVLNQRLQAQSRQFR